MMCLVDFLCDETPATQHKRHRERRDDSKLTGPPSKETRQSNGARRVTYLGHPGDSDCWRHIIHERE